MFTTKPIKHRRTKRLIALQLAGWKEQTERRIEKKRKRGRKKGKKEAKKEGRKEGRQTDRKKRKERSILSST